MAPLPTDAPEELAPPKRVIRTFASDMAALAGKSTAAQTGSSTPTPTPVAQTVDQPRTETNDGVTTAEVDESLITQDSFRKGEQPLDLDAPEEGGSVSVFEQPKEAPPVTPVSLAPNPANEREAVLARLKARAQAGSVQAQAVPPEPSVVTPPTPVVPPPVTPPPPPAMETLPPLPPLKPKPLFADTFEIPKTQYREPIPEVIQAPVAPPPVVEAPRVPAVEPRQPERYHGYTTDFAKQLDTKKASTFSVLAAEADSGRKPTTRIVNKSARSQNVGVFVLSGLLVLIGIGAVLGSWFFFTQTTPTIPEVVSVTNLISYDEKKELTGRTGQELLIELATLSEEPLVSGNVLVAYISTASTTTKGLPVSLPAPGGDLVKALPLLAPDILMRNIEDQSVVGIISSGGETRPFFVLTVSSYERTFRGMLSYESSMRQALGRLYPPYAQSVSLGESTASTTSAVQSPSFSILLEPTGFVDAVVRNYDVRILRDSQGRSIMLYGYKDKETLIIARDESAFIDLVTRLNAKAP